ncbi:MAG: tetratricopeptide repeat protein [Cytophagaceae bacterium]|nr:tetratricopeptide repeat protein [Cytophagaceae bacterium]
MKTHTSKFLIFVFVFISCFGQAQDKGKKYIAKLESEAKIFYERFEFHKALELYLELDSLSPNVPRYHYYIGVCYVNQQKNQEAIPYLEKCLLTPEKFPRNLDFYAAKAYHQSHRFDSAMIHYDIYRHKLKNTKKNRPLIEEVTRDIASCTYGKELMSNPVKIKIVNLGPVINSKYADYGPVLSADQE